MKMNNKGLTLIELLAVIVIIGVLSGIAINAITKSITSGHKKGYKNLEQNLRTAAKDYYTVHTDILVPGGDFHMIDAAELHDAGFLDNLNDPIDKKICDYDNSYVRTRASYKDDNSYNLTYEYVVCLRCSNYESPTCSNKN